ncbi:MAG: hypothetical protein ACC645_07785 [Pirellulales bacterium]
MKNQRLHSFFLAILLISIGMASGMLATGPVGWAADTAQDKAGEGKRPVEEIHITVGSVPVEVRHTYTTEQGLPDDSVTSVVVGHQGTLYAGTDRGIARYEKGRWRSVTDYGGPVRLLAVDGDRLLATADWAVYVADADGPRRLADLPSQLEDMANLRSLAGGKTVLLGSTRGLFELDGEAFAPVDSLHALMGDDRDVRQVASAEDGRVAVAALSGLYLRDQEGTWRGLQPGQGDRSWQPRDVRGVAFDRQGNLWFASPQGVGVLRGDRWTLYTGEDGLPYNDFTVAAKGEDGVVWFGTAKGAIRFDGHVWEYRTAPRWLPDNGVRAIAVTGRGDAWFATAKGVGQIERKPMTLAEKARFFEDEIDRYHRRTEYGFVDSVHLDKPGDKSHTTQRDSDNDGLWTAMYGAGECFAYGATKDPRAKERAVAAFRALKFLCDVTQGGSHPAPPGFPARTVLPTSGPNPNTTQYTAEHDRQRQKDDPLWKVIVPRWPTSADGKWYWKCDTSSDELDGHYFFYAAYYDLVAQTPEEKAVVRDVVIAITDHLIEHDFELVDHDGKTTRWARFGPAVLNYNVMPGTRGLNSLSILSYLKVAEHMTGDPKYRRAYDLLVNEHAYATNVLDPKWRNGPGTGNQSDDEMAFMCYYNLLRYETDPRLLKMYRWSLRWHWISEEPERCPLFNFVYGALDDGSPMSALRVPGPQRYLADAVDTLKRIPLDRVRWAFHNSHRLDVAMISDAWYRLRPGGHFRNGQVLPVDERDLEHWNSDPWTVDGGDGSRTLADGTAYLLPYYLGRYHGFIVETP